MNKDKLNGYYGNGLLHYLHLYAPVSEKSGFADHSAFVTSPVYIEAAQPDSLVEARKVPLRYDAHVNTVVVDGRSFPLNAWVATKYGELKFLPNKYYKRSAKPLDFYFPLLPVQDVADNLLSALKVEASSKQSTVINLSFTDEVRQRAEDILNKLMAEYREASVNDKNALAANTLTFVEDRLRYLVRELDSVEGSLQRFRTRNQVIDIGSQGKLYLENVGSNDKQISDLSMQLAVLDQVEDYVSGKVKTGSIVPSTLGIADPVLSRLLESLYETEMQYERVKKTTPENNPLMTSLVDQMDKIRPSILENIYNQRKSLQAGKANRNSVKKMRIVFLCGSLEAGRDGVGDYTRRLAAEIIRQGHEVAVVALYDSFIPETVNSFQETEGLKIAVCRISSSWPAKKRFLTAQQGILLSEILF